MYYIKAVNLAGVLTRPDQPSVMNGVVVVI